MKISAVILTVVLALVGGFVGAGFWSRGGQQTEARVQESTFERVMRTNTLRCGYAIWFPGMAKDPNTGRLSGVSYDLMEEIGRRTGIKVEWTQEAGFGSAEQDLVNGKYDVLCADVCFEARRTRHADFSRPYLVGANYLTVRADDTRFDNEVTLVNAPSMTIATYANTVFDTYKKFIFPQAKGVDVSELGADVDTMMALTTKKVDAAFNNQISVDRFNEANGVKAKTIGKPLAYCNGSFMLPAGDYRLKYFIDSAIEEITAKGILDTITKKYLPDDERYWVRPATTLR